MLSTAEIAHVDLDQLGTRTWDPTIRELTLSVEQDKYNW